MQEHFKNYKYAINSVQGFDLNTALRLWKAKFDTVKHFKRDVITHPALAELGQFVEEVWEDINPVTVQEALALQNLEHRRLYFDCIGVSKLFQSLEPKLLDRQVLKKTRKRWNEDNQEWDHHFEDVYELYEIDGNKLFGDLATASWMRAEPVFAVRCWCTTTNREYWIYVPRMAATGQRWASDKDIQPDAIRAIAWTIRLDITHPKHIYRQGDIIVAEASENSQKTSQYHLTKEQYLSLVCSET